MLYNLPIESLEERYSAHWNREFPKAFSVLHVPFVTIHPDIGATEIRHGQFLDVLRTNEFKARQLADLITFFDQGLVAENDVILFADLWNPCLEMLFYIRDGLKIDFKIAGMLHAGTYDPNDFLTQQGMGRWAARVETVWWSEVNAVFVATNYHKNLLLQTRALANPRIVQVTGFPLFETPNFPPISEKQNIIVFPHRLAPEKNPEDFKILKKLCTQRLPGWQFIRTKDVCHNKQEYFDLLKKSKIAVSCASQETWGIAQQEALFRGCIPVIPNRLSYPEMYHALYRYETLEQAAEMIVHFAQNYDWMVADTPFRDTVTQCHARSQAAVPNMIHNMREQRWRV